MAAGDDADACDLDAELPAVGVSSSAGRPFGDGRLRTFLEAERAAETLYRRELADLVAIAGEPVEPIADRWEQAMLLETVRRLLTRYISARLT